MNMTLTVENTGPAHGAMSPTQVELGLEFARSFCARHGRRLRVLHIGNIANNAYNNAVIQRSFGIEADVLCYDYYHVMGCPEWEDANYTGTVDSFWPDWWSTSLGGWRRPHWFAQGPVDLASAYLLAKSADVPGVAEALWRLLQAHYWILLERRRHGAESSRPPPPSQIAKAVGYLRGDDDAFLKDIIDALGVDANVDPNSLGLENIASLMGAAGRQFVRRTLSKIEGNTKSWIIQQVTAAPPGLALPMRRLHRKLREKTGIGFSVHRKRQFSRFDPRSHEFLHEVLKRTEKCRSASARSQDEMLSSSAAIADAIQTNFAGYDQDAVANVVSLARHVSPLMGPLLNHYDIIQGYSIDGFHPVALGFENYTAYEHGTLRDIPFGNDLNAIAANFAYKNAAYSFVTNCDVLPSVARLNLRPERVVYLPHAFNDVRISKFVAQNPNLAPPQDRAIIFSPSRHHWLSEPVSMQKGNDKLIRGAAMAARVSRNFELIFVDWGVDVEKSRSLIRELGLEDRVTWIPPLSKQDLLKKYCASHAVADQFSLPAMGGVCFEAMALGRRVITWIDPEEMTKFFGKAPPCLTANSAETCRDQILAVLNDIADEKGLGPSVAEWMRNYHSSRRIVGLQSRCYRSMLDPGSSARPRASTAEAASQHSGDHRETSPCSHHADSLDQAQQTSIALLEQRLADHSMQVARQLLVARSDFGRIRRSLEQTNLVSVPTVDNSRLMSKSHQLELLRNRCPTAFPLWEETSLAGAEEYEARPTHSLSLDDNTLAPDFANFVSAHASGFVLDVGCGPQPTPLYLRDIPTDRIFGIDPLGSPGDHPFQFVCGYGEYLPFADEAFNTVVSGTSLDHALLLDATLSEIKRVLAPDGRFLVWIGIVPSAEDYDPYSASVRKIDAFHLFHFNNQTFERAIGGLFAIRERLDFPGSSFYSLSRRHGSAQRSIDDAI
jgi:SAM-dependent methyltransferase/glycosyltransferase involved in cell wall biosynthesis